MDTAAPIAIMAALGAVVVTALTTFKKEEADLDNWGTQVEYVSSPDGVGSSTTTDFTKGKGIDMDTNTDVTKGKGVDMDTNTDVTKGKGVDKGTDPDSDPDLDSDQDFDSDCSDGELTDDELDVNVDEATRRRRRRRRYYCMKKLKKCEEDPLVHDSTGKLVFKKSADKVDPQSTRELLKAFTTKHASEYLSNNKVALQFKALMNIENEIAKKGHELRFKGGLALRLCLIDAFNILFDPIPDHPDREFITKTILDSYASPSDLDSTLMVKEGSLQGEWEYVTTVVLSEFEKLRDDELVWYDHCKNIVDICNKDVEGLAKLKSKNIEVKSFAMKTSRNMKITSADQSTIDSNPEVCKNGCITLEREGSEQTMYSSNNSTLQFEKALQNVANFNLLRAKFSIQCTYNDDCVCTCPAELIDVSVPKIGDTGYEKYWQGSNNQFSYVYRDDSSGFNVTAINLQYQLSDLTQMLHEFLSGDDKTKSDKRLHRYFVLSCIHNILKNEITGTGVENNFDSVYQDIVLHENTDLNDGLTKSIKDKELAVDITVINALCKLISLRDQLNKSSDTSLFWSGQTSVSIEKLLSGIDYDLGDFNLVRQPTDANLLHANTI